MTIVIPKDQDEFNVLLHAAMNADYPDKRITLVTDTPYTSLDIPEGLARAIGVLPDPPSVQDDPETDGGEAGEGETSADRAPDQGAPAAADGDERPAGTAPTTPAPTSRNGKPGKPRNTTGEESR